MSLRSSRAGHLLADALPTPPLAVALTILTGFFLFLFMGYNRSRRLPRRLDLLTFYGLSELAVKAAPLITIAVGLAIGFRANVWNIGAEGQLTMGALAGGGIALATWGQAGAGSCRHDGRRHPGRHGLCRHPGLPQGPARGQRDPDQPDAHLRRHPVPERHGLRAVRSEGYGFPQSRMFTESAIVPIIVEGTRLHIGAMIAPPWPSAPGC